MARTQSICVVDDAADYRFILQQVFKRFFPVYTVEFFPEGQALLDGLAQINSKPGLILLDQHMVRTRVLAGLCRWIIVVEGAGEVFLLLQLSA